MTNTVQLIGRLVEDPTLKSFDGFTVTNVVLAVSRPFKNRQGEYDTDFIKVALWDFNAKLLCDYCSKGDLIGIRGRAQCRNNEVSFDYEGTKVKKKLAFIEIIGERIVFLNVGKKKEKPEEVIEYPDTDINDDYA